MTRKCPAADLTTEATAAPEVITRHDTRRDTGACSSLNCRSVARPDGLQASTLQRAAHRHLNAIQRKIHRRLQGMMLLIHDNTRQAAQDHLDAAALVDTATLGVHVFDAHADPFDWPCKLAKLAAELASQVGSIRLIDHHADRTDEHGCMSCHGAPAVAFERPCNLRRHRRTVCAVGPALAAFCR